MGKKESNPYPPINKKPPSPLDPPPRNIKGTKMEGKDNKIEEKILKLRFLIVVILLLLVILSVNLNLIYKQIENKIPIVICNPDKPREGNQKLI